MSKLWSNEQADLFNRLIWKYAREYIRSRGMIMAPDRLDDYVQEVWLKIAETKKKDPAKEMTAGYIRDVVNGEFADMIRKDTKDPTIDIDAIEKKNDSRKNDEYSSTEFKTTKQVNDPQKDAEIVDILSLIDKLDQPGFEKQRDYLKWFMEKEGLKDYGIRPKLELGGKEDGYTDTNLARYLGFTGTADHGYKALKRNMQKLLRVYLGEKN